MHKSGKKLLKLPDLSPRISSQSYSHLEWMSEGVRSLGRFMRASLSVCLSRVLSWMHVIGQMPYESCVDIQAGHRKSTHANLYEKEMVQTYCGSNSSRPRTHNTHVHTHTHTQTHTHREERARESCIYPLATCPIKRAQVQRSSPFQLEQRKQGEGGLCWIDITLLVFVFAQQLPNA